MWFAGSVWCSRLLGEGFDGGPSVVWDIYIYIYFVACGLGEAILEDEREDGSDNLRKVEMSLQLPKD